MPRTSLIASALTVSLVAAALLVVGRPAPRSAIAGDPFVVHVADTRPASASDGEAVATFAAGCFWCVQADFDKVRGVLRTIVGYTGGMTLNPTYDDVATGYTGHAEALQVIYDPKQVTYSELLDYYWRHTDIVDGRGQFCDRGSAYRPMIFAHDDEQYQLAKQGKEQLQKSGRFLRPVAVQVARATAFTPAEPEHQEYYKRNPRRYALYRWGCGRDARLQQLWGDRTTH